MSTSTRELRIAIFNLCFDETDPILGHTVSWARQFLTQFREVHVYSMRVGDFSEEDNLFVTELGGRFRSAKINAIYRIALALLYILKRRKNFVVFYHMTERISGIISPILKLARVKQVLWYSHSSANFFLRISAEFCDLIYSPTSKSFPLKSKKLRTIGHGISQEFKLNTPFTQRLSHRVLYLGRVSRIKKIEELILALDRLEPEIYGRYEIDVVGPILDAKYWNEILGIASECKIALNYRGSYPRRDIPDILNKYKFTYTGNPATVDKSAVEALACGCMLLTTVPTLWEHLHIGEVYLEKFSEKIMPSLDYQIIEFLSIGEGSISALSKLSKRVKKENGLEFLIADMTNQIKSLL